MFENMGLGICDSGDDSVEVHCGDIVEVAVESIVGIQIVRGVVEYCTSHASFYVDFPQYGTYIDFCSIVKEDCEFYVTGKSSDYSDEELLSFLGCVGQI
jgi:hypothetical protein